MFLTAFVSVLILLFYFFTAFNVGRCRTRLGVPAPRMDGPDEFQRYARVQQNTLEQLVVVLPLLAVFAYVISDAIAALLGLVWLAARIWYAFAYYKEAGKRMGGFLTGLLVTVILFVADLIALAMAVIDIHLS